MHEVRFGKRSSFISNTLKSNNIFQGLLDFYHLRWEINESFNISFFVKLRLHQVFKFAMMNWVSLIRSVLGYPFCIKKEHPLVLQTYCPASFLSFQSWHCEGILGKYSNFSYLVWIKQKVSSLTPINELNNYTSQEMKNDFLKVFLLNQR